MGDAFSVRHGDYSNLNDNMMMSVRQMGTILDDVNGTLNKISLATSGKATPLWQEHGNQWNSAYNDMHLKLQGHHNNSLNVANLFQEGDNQGGRIMS